jgi:hypothetical protein
MTLTNYHNIWKKLESGIGEQWFQLPFGQFMRTYFTRGIPLPSSSTSASLSDLFLPYPTSRLPYLQQIHPEITEREDLLSILRNPMNSITINYKNLFDLQKEDIIHLLNDKPHIVIHLNNRNMLEMNISDVFILDLIELINLCKENPFIKINGKQLIRTMLKISNNIYPHKDDYLQKYQPIYDSLHSRIWAIQEEEWEIQPEIINTIYNEIQLMKEQRGLLHRTIINEQK